MRNTTSFCIYKNKVSDSDQQRRIPVRVPYAPHPKGELVYNPDDNFVYVSDGTTWDRVNGVNNPVDILLPVTRSKVPRWIEDYPPGMSYLSPVLQDSSLEVDDDGNGILNDTGNQLSSFPWTNGNLLCHGSMVTNYTFGLGLDSADPTSFIPIITPLKGSSSTSNNLENSNIPKNKEIYEEGSISIGYGSMENLILKSLNPESSKNTSIGVASMRYATEDAKNNVSIGWKSMEGVNDSGVKGAYNVSIGTENMKTVTTASNNVSIGHYATTGSTNKNMVVIGSESLGMGNGNVILGANSIDNGHDKVIILGSNGEANGNNRIVLGSGIEVVTSMNGGYAIQIQIGNETYQIPLIKVT